MKIVLIANRTRDFAVADGADLPLFDADQKLGPWFDRVAEKLGDARHRVRLTTSEGKELNLRGEPAWKGFWGAYLRSSDAALSDRAAAEAVFKRLGISFPNLVMFLDDIAAAPATDSLEIDARIGESLAKLLGLYGEAESYADRRKYNDEYNERFEEAPLSAGSDAVMRLALRPALHGDIMRDVSPGIFGLDRMEVESSADFVFSDAADATFANAVVSGPWEGLSVQALDEVDWSDNDRADLLLSYQAPVSMERRRNGDYRISGQPFKEVYLETDDGLLARHALSLRVRSREEQNRWLIQMKLELPPHPTTGRPVREKWERRLRGRGYLNDLEIPLSDFVNITQAGYALGVGMPELKKLFDLLVKAGALDATKSLALRPDHIVLQRRMRARLLLDTLAVTQARAQLLAERASQPGAHANLKKYQLHVQAQVASYAACQAAVTRHTRDGDELGGECVLMSWDRWAAFEPGAFGRDQLPSDFTSSGVRGRGLRTETELDAWTTQSLDEAIATIEKKMASNSGAPAELEGDLAAIRAFQQRCFHDVELAGAMMKSQMLAAGLRLAPQQSLSKSDQAVAMMAEGQGGHRRGHRYWW